ncbi:hypothetical protein D3C71_1966220 [compost metagenome]
MFWFTAATMPASTPIAVAITKAVSASVSVKGKPMAMSRLTGKPSITMEGPRSPCTRRHR